MTSAKQPLWNPRSKDLSGSCVAEIMRRTKQSSYDELHAFSIAEPAEYWRILNDYLGIVWRKDYVSYCDLSRGKAHPDWFVGGELNWTDTVLAWADNAATSGKTAIIAEREEGVADQVTYRELRTLVIALAAGLAQHNVRRGDRIGLLMENGIEASATLLALSYLGAIVVPLFSGFGAEPIVSRLRACKAKGLIATTGFSRRGRFVDTVAIIEEVRAALPGLELLVLKPPSSSSAAFSCPKGYIQWSDLRSSAGGEHIASETMSPDDPFMVIFTSGTTGKPKGAVHTHGGFPLKIAHDAALHFNVIETSVFCWPADMGWIAGALILATALTRGATLVCYDGAPDYPDWSRMAKLIARHRVTHFGSAPTLIRGLCANSTIAMSADVSSIELLITAGEGIAPEHFTWFQNNFGRGEAPLINYTGGTEVSGGLLSSVVVKPIVPAGFNARSAGVAVDVVGAGGTSLVDEVGELAVREPFVGMTRSFWEDDARYLDSYWTALPGTWIHGDLAMQTADGHFFMLGRSDDTIKVAGKRVGPAEVEEIILEIAGIDEAAVIGAPDQAKGEVIVAFLVAPRHASLSQLQSEVKDRVERKLGKPFAPKRVFVVEQLPKTRSSKIMRRVIRNLYIGSPQGDVTGLVNPEAIDEITRLIRSA